MKKVYITRQIPEIGISMLLNKGYEVDINHNNRPLTQDELVSILKAKEYDAVLTLLTDKIDAKVFDASPSTKIFANLAIGYDNFDVAEGKKRGIYLTNTPGGGANRVAEHAWAMILGLACRIDEGDRFMREGKYTGWDPMLLQGISVRNKVLGLIGAGRIGSDVARIAAQAFGMRVVYYDIKRNSDLESVCACSYYHSVEEVLKVADVVSLHVPLLDSTRHLMNSDRLSMMKPTAFLINTSRGPVVDENALVLALKNKVIAGAGLDVFEFEPKVADGLMDIENVIMTPHIASSTVDSRNDMAILAAQNIINTLEGGKPKDLVYN